jgi:hypothetical protein
VVYPYKINAVEDLYKLSDLACKEDFPVYISTPYGQIDARSVLGLFTVIGKDIHLVAPDHADVKDFHKFLDKLGRN